MNEIRKDLFAIGMVAQFFAERGDPVEEFGSDTGFEEQWFYRVKFLKNGENRQNPKEILKLLGSWVSFPHEEGRQKAIARWFDPEQRNINDGRLLRAMDGKMFRIYGRFRLKIAPHSWSEALANGAC